MKKRVKPLKFGIVGACGRGASFKTACEASGQVSIQAVCDINEAALPAAAQRLGAQACFSDYEQMLEQSGIDAVIIGTPMPLHVPQAIAALARGIHVMSEVPAGVSVAECRKLVAACKKSPAIYMMAENYTYTESNVLIRELVRQGCFGTPYYAEGEYLHELKALNEVTKWRRTWQTGIPGITYGCYESGRGGPSDRGKIWLRSLSRDLRWIDLDAFFTTRTLARKYLPDMWRKASETARRAGHGGGDYFEVLDFVNAITGQAPCPIGIHEAMDMTLPGLVSQQSITANSRWIDVPDSRTW